MRGAPLVRACLLGVLVTVLGAGTLHAQHLQIEAPSFHLDQATHTYTYEDGKLTLGPLTLFASHLVLNSVTGQIHASGFIRVQNNVLYGTADSLDMNARTRTGVFHGAKLFLLDGGLYIRANTAVVHEDGRLELESCDLTSCKPDVPGAWHLLASTVHMEPEGLGVAWNPRLWLGPFPVFYFPIFAWPTVTERTTGVLGPRISEDTASLQRYNLGWRLQVPVFLNLGYDQDLTLSPEIIQHRGLALRLEYNYAFWPQQRGQLYWWGLHERKPRDPTQENDILTPLGLTPPDTAPMRYKLNWVHNQGFGDNERLVLSYEDSSDGQVRSEYDHVPEYRPYHTYQASLASQGSVLNTALTFEQHANFTQDSVYATSESNTNLRQIPQVMPSLRTNVGGRPVPGFPLRLDLGLRAVRFVAPQSLTGHLLEASPSVSLPIPLGGAFELRPTFTRRMVAYTGLLQGDTTSGLQTQIPSDGFDQNEASLELRTRLARVYATDGSPYAAIKHRIVPRAIFTEVQDVPQPFAGQLEAARVAEKLLTLRLDNTLLGAASLPQLQPDAPPGSPQPEPSVAELLHLNLVQRYDLLLRTDQPPLEGPAFTARKESLPGHPWLPLEIQFGTSTAAYDIGAVLHYHYQLHRPTLFNLSLVGHPAGTSLGVNYQTNEFDYVTPDNQLVGAGSTFGFSASLPLTDSLGLSFGGRINLVDGSPPLDRRLDSDSVVLTYNPACYAIRAVYSETVTYTLDNGTPNFYMDRHLRIIFDLSGLIGGLKHRTQPPPDILTSTGFDHDRAPASCHS